MNKPLLKIIKFAAVGFIGLGLLLVLMSALRTTKFTPTDKVQLTASFYPMAEFAQQVGGELVEVHNLTPAGAEPHDFEPLPQDLVTLANSKIFIYNGAGLEVWLAKIGDDIRQHLQLVNASQDIPLLSTSNESAGNQVQQDPHVWLDPVLAKQEVENIKNGLISVDVLHENIYQKNATAYQRQLSDLDLEFSKGLAQCQRRTIVTSHNAFQYLAKRYGLEVLSISGLSPDEEPSPQQLAQVVEFVRQNQVKYIFFESLVSPKLSETIAKETGAKTIVFNPLEGLSQVELDQGKDYISVQKDNLTALRMALECK